MNSNTLIDEIRAAVEKQETRERLHKEYEKALVAQQDMRAYFRAQAKIALGVLHRDGTFSKTTRIRLEKYNSVVVFEGRHIKPQGWRLPQTCMMVFAWLISEGISEEEAIKGAWI